MGLDKDKNIDDKLLTDCDLDTILHSIHRKIEIRTDKRACTGEGLLGQPWPTKDGDAR